ncbi:MAG: DNA primase [Patescibacteria group bacterium]|jgi:DNA primase
MSQVEDIKSKLDIVEVIREYLPVKAVGVNFQALCPFHNEKTPSFVISPDKQIWHCFGCGRGGDVFSFVMEKEGLSFPEALRLLATKAGVELRYENRKQTSQRNRWRDILELSGKYYAHILSTKSGEAAREYLAKRRLSEATIKDWQLGYSLDSWEALLKFLTARPLTGTKYTEAEILATGLIIHRTDQSPSRYYDRFRARIMFPIRDHNNNLVGFTARLSPEQEANDRVGKYINSPQTELYDKSKILFGLNKAKGAIKKEDLAIVVEGQMDVISCHQHGFENVVASSGTALSSDQVKLLKRYTNNIALAFDMDQAGQLAVDRGIKEVLAQGLSLKVITLPDGKDPDEILQHDPADFKAAIASAQLMLDYYFTKISQGLDLNLLDNKLKIRDLMFAMISLVPSQTEQGYWLKKLSEELDFAETDLRAEFKTRSVAPRSEQEEGQREEASPKVYSREQRLSESLLALVLRFPEIFSYAIDNLAAEQLSGKINQDLYQQLIIYYSRTQNLNYDNLRQELEEQGEGKLDMLILLGEKDFYELSPSTAKTELIKLIVELKKYSFQARIKKLQKEISLAEQTTDNRELDRLMTELKQAMDELKKLI